MNEKLIEGILDIICKECKENDMHIVFEDKVTLATAIAERLVVDKDKLFCLLNSLQEYRDIEMSIIVKKQ